MELIEVKPPYNTHCIISDEDNPNVWDEKLWQDWIKSVDYIQFDYDKDLVSTEDLVVKLGHRGIRIGKVYEVDGSWYYNVSCGYKIKE